MKFLQTILAQIESASKIQTPIKRFLEPMKNQPKSQNNASFTFTNKNSPKTIELRYNFIS